MKRYNPTDIEPRWQKQWEESKIYEVTEDSAKTKKYVAGMFPYPSGAGLHVGHVRNYSIVDVIARFQRQLGHNVMNPIGWDTFGLPAENYAIKTGTPPAVSTAENIKNFKNQLSKLGMSYDWSRELNTSDPEYYKWTQWIFTKLFERGLAYQKESAQWWCPVDKTVLANEQVEGGKCWRCGSNVVKKSMKQWFFKITEYAEPLLQEIDNLDWPEHIKTMQRNWIGKSEGAEVEFQLDNGEEIITVFTTRPDTLFGASFVVLAPEHTLVQKVTTNDRKEAVEAYVDAAIRKSEIERMDESREKTGSFTGSYVINPVNGEKLPVWVADYVLVGYGTGAVMAVPGHDQRDYEFAEKFDLPIIQVIEKPEDDDETGVYSGEGALVNSGHFDGMQSSEAREEIVAWLEQQNVGRAKVTYKMRDWLISRQRYWGAPIPIAYDKNGKAHVIPEDQLPVTLPEVEDYAPDGSGQSILAREKDWLKVTINGEEMTRETDTMDGYACSSWYLLRYTDPHNAEKPWDPAKANYWSPVDFYCGGDHAVAHLLYVRFWAHALKDMGLLDHPEPVRRLVYNGYINAQDGRKMSKSLGNVVDPLELVNQGYGADALRVYELFIGPYDLDASWDPRGIAGTYRFLNRVWNITQEQIESNTESTAEIDAQVTRAMHKAIKKVTDDLTELRFNTAIAALMEYVNELYKLKAEGMQSDTWRQAIEVLQQLVAPFAPHITEELWHDLGKEGSVHTAQWPSWDESLLTEDTITVAVQVNGKLRGEVNVAKDATEEVVKEAALANENVQQFVASKGIRRVVYVPGRLLNIVV